MNSVKIGCNPKISNYMRRIKRKRKVTGVVLDESVIAYLDDLAEKEERNRSYFINRIIREHAERNGNALPAGDIEENGAPGNNAAGI